MANVFLNIALTQVLGSSDDRDRLDKQCEEESTC